LGDAATWSSDQQAGNPGAGQLTSRYSGDRVVSDIPKSTLFFDGSCPLCRAEIGYYRRHDQAGALCFVDVSEPGAVTPEGITQRRAMERFHVRASDGRVLSGAAAFVEVWTHLPKWRWAARAASLPGALAALDLAYRTFLPVLPFLSRLFGRVFRLQALIGGAKRR
jgi:predicted DCC family thiol-disulfide oxidoreductase YuxK